MSASSDRQFSGAGRVVEPTAVIRPERTPAVNERSTARVISGRVASAAAAARVWRRRAGYVLVVICLAVTALTDDASTPKQHPPVSRPAVVAAPPAVPPQPTPPPAPTPTPTPTHAQVLAAQATSHRVVRHQPVIRTDSSDDGDDSDNSGNSDNAGNWSWRGRSSWARSWSSEYRWSGGWGGSSGWRSYRGGGYGWSSGGGYAGFHGFGCGCG